MLYKIYIQTSSFMFFLGSTSLAWQGIYEAYVFLIDK